MDEDFPPGSASSMRGHRIDTAYRQFLDALAARPDPKIVSDDPNIERAIWEAVEATFRAHGSYFGSDPKLPFPHGISWFVADAISELMAGGEPASWQTIRHTGKRSGAPKRASPERNQIWAAVAYIKGAKKNLIDDKRPQKTVRDVFGVGESTVRGWCADSEFECINTSLSAASNPNLGELLRTLMLDGGRLYQKSRRTRSQTAIARRAAKRNG